MDAIDELSAVREIESLKARYFRCMDQKDWAGLREVLAPDVVTDFPGHTRGGPIRFDNVDDYLADITPVLDRLDTVHHGHMPEIELLDDSHATGIWAMEDLLWAHDDAGLPWQRLQGFGHYHETYERIGGRWRITSIRLSRLRVILD